MPGGCLLRRGTPDWGLLEGAVKASEMCKCADVFVCPLITIEQPMEARNNTAFIELIMLNGRKLN